MVDLGRVHRMIEAVAPIDGVGLVSASPLRIRIDFRPEATREQRTAALAAVQSFDPAAKTPAEQQRDADKSTLAAFLAREPKDDYERALQALIRLRA